LGIEYAIAVIGSGPAGMSAAARAAKRGQPHILLERSSHLTSTVHGYQKRKHVMAAPQMLPVRSDIRFDAGTREEVLDHWNRDVARAHVNIRLKSEVTAITGRRGAFAIQLADGATITAAHVILAIGTGGNPRKLTIPGADLPFVQYSLADADDHSGETVIVIGAGDSAIEDAIALTAGNEVVLVNRGSDFHKAKPANAAQIAAAIAGGRVRAIDGAAPTRIEPGAIFITTGAGETRVACDRVIARLGTMPPAAFLES
jgi:cGMP-dependent protein kinase 2